MLSTVSTAISCPRTTSVSPDFMAVTAAASNSSYSHTVMWMTNAPSSFISMSLLAKETLSSQSSSAAGSKPEGIGSMRLAAAPGWSLPGVTGVVFC